MSSKKVKETKLKNIFENTVTKISGSGWPTFLLKKYPVISVISTSASATHTINLLVGKK